MKSIQPLSVLTNHLPMAALMAFVLTASCYAQTASSGDNGQEATDDTDWLQWNDLGDIPDPLGVAGPFVGVHGKKLIVAGGANFPLPIWESEKQWHDKIYAGVRTSEGISWQNAGDLPRRIAYGVSVSTRHGVVCAGGNDGQATFASVSLLAIPPKSDSLSITDLPSLPEPRAYAGGGLIGPTVYVTCGQSGAELESSTNTLWSLNLGDFNADKLKAGQSTADGSWGWQVLPPVPGPPRAFPIVATQHNGFERCLYVISGRCLADGKPQFLRDVWEFSPSKQQWRQRADAPQCFMAGSGIDLGQSHILILGGDDGSLFGRADELKDDHPGFPREAFAYHTITDTWTSAGKTPQNHVTTTAVRWQDDVIVASGEIRPRVRSPEVWAIQPLERTESFGFINYLVLTGYLLAMVGIGIFFARRNKNADDYFRGGKKIPWWAAGCSIFATMLSSLTFTGLPSKAYAQDWVYSIGNFMIPVSAFAAVYVAMPFFRRIDATSAYEYLEKRFSRRVRLFGSMCFTLFHVFRMAVVLSLTGLALAVATPLTPPQAVMVMGILSIVYCTMGGIEAVIWTDTVQAVVLLGGAACALVFLVQGTEGGFSGAWATAQDADKMRLANWHVDPFSTQIALWVIVIGAIAQNISSYTSDQAVVQRYMTTPDQSDASKSIWTNAVLSIPATVLFFGIGTALFAFYKSHPERLDPTMNTDQVFPLFIARELPIGLAGLIVAGIFAAAQSTVSTSMNSISTTIVVDFLRPLNRFASDGSYLKAARWITGFVGAAGTLLGLLFVNPEIKSLFDAFIVVIGLFMGVLGGLFCLGALSTRANATGALVGAITGAAVMFSLWMWSSLSGYLYTACGIATCFSCGYITSILCGGSEKELSGLTLHTLTSDSV